MPAVPARNDVIASTPLPPAAAAALGVAAQAAHTGCAVHCRGCSTAAAITMYATCVSPPYGGRQGSCQDTKHLTPAAAVLCCLSRRARRVSGAHAAQRRQGRGGGGGQRRGRARPDSHHPVRGCGADTMMRQTHAWVGFWCGVPPPAHPSQTTKTCTLAQARNSAQ